jgi:hypothetical protein
MKKTRLVFKKSMAHKLMQMGNIVYDVIPNYKKEGFVVWAFEENEKFNNDFEQVLKENNQE